MKEHDNKWKCKATRTYLECGPGPRILLQKNALCFPAFI